MESTFEVACVESMQWNRTMQTEVLDAPQTAPERSVEIDPAILAEVKAMIQAEASRCEPARD